MVSASCQFFAANAAVAFAARVPVGTLGQRAGQAGREVGAVASAPYVAPVPRPANEQEGATWAHRDVERGL